LKKKRNALAHDLCRVGDEHREDLAKDAKDIVKTFKAKIQKNITNGSKNIEIYDKLNDEILNIKVHGK